LTLKEFKSDSYFSYIFHGATRNRILVIQSFSGGGSSIFSSLLFLKTEVIFKLNYKKTRYRNSLLAPSSG